MKTTPAMTTAQRIRATRLTLSQGPDGRLEFTLVTRGPIPIHDSRPKTITPSDHLAPERAGLRTTLAHERPNQLHLVVHRQASQPQNTRTHLYQANFADSLPTCTALTG